LHQFFAVSAAWLALSTIIFGALIVYGCASIQSDFHTKAHCSADALLTKEIAITFDDGPNAEFTPKVLSKLAEFKAPAAFFLIGKNIQGNEDLVRQMDSEGHIIGNHTFTHSFFIDFKSPEGLKEELTQTADAIREVIGKRIKLFRPPYGVTTPNLAKAAEGLKYNVIGWNIRSFDTTRIKEETITKRVLRQIKPGAVILFHDTSEKTVNVLVQTLHFLRQNGYKIVSIERLLNIPSYEYEEASC
jgi:peptidoglycan/xylan/chitin deacetylase (PgdA/CDA1 family)